MKKFVGIKVAGLEEMVNALQKWQKDNPEWRVLHMTSSQHHFHYTIFLQVEKETSDIFETAEKH